MVLFVMPLVSNEAKNVSEKFTISLEGRRIDDKEWALGGNKPV